MRQEKKIYTPKRRGQWRIEVTGDDNDAHIRAFGNVPKDVRKSVELKENCGLKNTFKGLCMLATLLTE
jgi:hypothetical protein